MPIYEFYCLDCHAILSFRARRIDTASRPDCPRCGHPALERRVSPFAISRGRKEDAAPVSPGDGIDDGRLEQAFAALASEMESLDEDDPRQAAQLMRRLYHAAGLSGGPAMEEAMGRLEAGEDPEAIERELGPQLEQEGPFAAGAARGSLRDLRRRLLPPAVDETLYEM